MSSLDFDNSSQIPYEGIPSRSVNWEEIYLDLDLLRLTSELDRSFSPSQRSTLQELLRMGANIEGSDGDFSDDYELDEIYDDVGRLTENTPLIWSIIAENLGAIEFLLEAGANPNTPNGAGVSPLEIAIGLRNPEIVRILVTGGAKLNDPMEAIRDLEIEISNNSGDQRGNERLSQITAALYGMIFARVEQKGGYYL